MSANAWASPRTRLRWHRKAPCPKWRAARFRCGGGSPTGRMSRSEHAGLRYAAGCGFLEDDRAAGLAEVFQRTGKAGTHAGKIRDDDEDGYLLAQNATSPDAGFNASRPWLPKGLAGLGGFETPGVPHDQLPARPEVPRHDEPGRMTTRRARHVGRGYFNDAAARTVSGPSVTQALP